MKKCKKCGKPLGKRQTKFCSNRCVRISIIKIGKATGWKWNRKPKIKRICAICRKEFFIHPYRIKRAKYCSRVCQHVGSALKYTAFDTSKLNKEKIGYLAGLLDGEGCIYKSKSGYVAITITNTYYPLIKWLSKNINIGQVQKHRSKKHLQWKLRYNFRIRSAFACYHFLKLLQPYLIIKKELAKKTIDFLQNRYHF